MSKPKKNKVENKDCGMLIYPYDFEDEGVCPYCGCTDLIPTDEDEQ